MSWEHDLAKNILNKSPSISAGWYEGEVVSPVRTIDPETEEPVYTGPLVVTAFGGDVTLQEDRLVSMESETVPYAGCRVALMGDVFSKGAGGQKVLVLGVTHLAV